MSELDEIYDELSELVNTQSWHVLNNKLEELVLNINDCDIVNIDILLAHAIMTLPVKNNIPYRDVFMKKCMEFHPDPTLWMGLITDEDSYSALLATQTLNNL